MKLQLIRSQPTTALILEHTELIILRHIFSFLNAHNWREQYSREITEEDLDKFIQSMRSQSITIIKAVDKSNEALRHALVNSV